MSNIELSVLMTNFNHGRFIGESLHAIVEQLYPLKEIIIIDDASTDHSMEVIREFRDKSHNLRIIRNERNMGVVHNANTLLSLSSGKYVFFAAADDRVLSGFFGKATSLLSKHPEAGLCSGLSTVIDEDGDEIGLHQSGIVSDVECYLPPEDVAAILSKRAPWFMGNTTIYRRQCLIDIGGFRPELEAFCDGFASLVIALKYGACFIPEPLSSWRRMDTGYAATYDRNTEDQLRTLGYAKNLMVTTYKDIFPVDYVIRWERRKLFEWEVTKAVALSAKRVSCVKRTLDSAGVIGKISYILVRVVLRAILDLTKLNLLIGYRQPIYPILLNKVKRLVNP